MSQKVVPGTNVFFRFFRTGQTVRRLMLAAVEGSGVTGDEYGVLSAVRALGLIRGTPGVPPTEMSRWLGMPATTVSTYVARFLERGLVRRSPNPDDGRSYLLELTPEGDAVIETVAPRLTAIVRQVAAESPVPLDEIAESLAVLDAAGRGVLDSQGAPL
jgi:DNA-binding MarR family transcriptional regulator